MQAGIIETVFLFSGQGSQYFHMGGALYEHNATFRNWMMRLDSVAIAASGRSVLSALYASSKRGGDVFNRTLMTHPAIFMVEYSLAQCLMEAGVWPGMVLGVSLGSFAAAAVAGFLDVEDALTGVISQARAIEEHCNPGGMTAVLADVSFSTDKFLTSRSELAAVNFSSHFVVSSRCAELDEINGFLAARGAISQRLPVSFAFHSKWIDEARLPFQSMMRHLRFKQTRTPLACCCRGEVLSELPPDYFWEVVRQPMRFPETISRLEQDGPRRYIDLSPGGTLATFIKYGTTSSRRPEIHTILTPFGTDQRNFQAVVAAVKS